MRGAESLTGSGPQNPEVDVQAYETDLINRLAITGLSVLQYGRRLATRTEEMAAKIAKHGERAPVAPDLPEFHDWLKKATGLPRSKDRGRELKAAPDSSILFVLAHFEPLYQDADRYFNG